MDLADAFIQSDLQKKFVNEPAIFVLHNARSLRKLVWEAS